jgi:hypothetical protein
MVKTLKRASVRGVGPRISGEVVKLTSKSTNPKDSVGVKKAYLSTVPMPMILEIGVAMLEGALKYGRHNYLIAGVRASVYYDAIMARHMPAWWEGEDTDEESGLSHLTKAAACLVVLRSAQIYGKLIDDRPPHAPKGWLLALNQKAAALIDKYPNPKPAYTFRDQEGFQEDMAALGTSVMNGEAFRAIGNGADIPAKRSRRVKDTTRRTIH